MIVLYFYRDYFNTQYNFYSKNYLISLVYANCFLHAQKDS